MQHLGYERYGVEGGDLGAYVAPQVATIAPDRVAGVYVIAGLGFPTEADVPEMTALLEGMTFSQPSRGIPIFRPCPGR